MFVSAYATYLGVPCEELVAGRGISEFIRLLAGLASASGAVVITPDYTDTVASFRHHLGPTEHTETVTRCAPTGSAKRSSPGC